MPFELAEEALVASGVKDKQGISHYLAKLKQLHSKFLSFSGPLESCSPLERAENLFHFLWVEKPNRYDKSGPFKLHTVIDNQLKEQRSVVGNCLGLTLLYNCLLSRLGIEAKAIYMENAFGKGPHVLSVVETTELSVEIENILPHGFNYKGHLGNTSRVVWDNRGLVADLYLGIGNEHFRQSRFDDALDAYNMSLRFNPGYEKAFLNRLILRAKSRRI